MLSLHQPNITAAMIEKSIDDIAYRIKRAKDAGKGAIVFIGAGCSHTGGIPPGSSIRDRIFERFSDAPKLKALDRQTTDFKTAMAALDSAADRKEVFREYVKNARVNASHIYLARLIQLGYVDYVVTTNFDNLMIRALALHNIFPAVYDLSSLDILGTETLDIQSVTYLHGTWNGLWQMATDEEQRQVVEGPAARNVFAQISLGRPWIIVGYSGSDPMFELLAAPSTYSNGLYWVGYKENPPIERVQDMLLKPPTKGAYWVKGHDADTFFLKLHARLSDTEPLILRRPLSFLEEVLEGVQDVMPEGPLESLNERLSIVKGIVARAIAQASQDTGDTLAQDTGQGDTAQAAPNLDSNTLLKLTDMLIYKNFDGLDQLVTQLQAKGITHYNSRLSGAYFEWGNTLSDLANLKSGPEAKTLRDLADQKYTQAQTLKPNA